MIQTSRGYQDPSIKQISIFLQNKVGELGDVLRHLEHSEIRVHAVSVSDSVDYAVVRAIVDLTDRAVRILTKHNFPVCESDVLAVELPDEGPGLLHMCRALLGAEINTHYAYAMISRPRGAGVMILNVDDADLGSEVLRKRGFYVLDESDLYEGDSS